LTDSHDPLHQIESKNPWYVDDHFLKQYNRRGPRAVIERRWKIFENAIEDFFIKSNTATSSSPARILDAGCGDGINLLGLNNMAQERSWNVSIYGSDYNPVRLERASKFSFVKETVQSPLDTMPYADDWFDVVLCNHVIEHIPQNKKVLLELKRIIRPSGLFIVGVPNEGCALAYLRNHIIQRSILKSTDHVNFYTEKSISNLLTNSGFLISKLEKAGFFLPHLGLNFLISNAKAGQWLLNILGHIFPSQSADLIVISSK
jgi:2-polyprenyl-3-methyl-5-hydroxy-6-metoxy-1,4-benzoquinol methylase